MADSPTRNRLGRGLAALIGDVENTAAAAAEPAGEQQRHQRRLPVAYLRPNPRNPRKAFAAADLDDLTASVREKGVVQPILVRPVDGASDSYEIVAGERRWRAAQKAGLHDVPVVVRALTDKEALELAIVENVQRQDLNALEEAIGYQQLIDGYGYSQNELAEVIGKSRPHIANTLRLLKLPDEVQAYLRDGKLTAGHARALVTLTDPVAAARKIVEAGLNVRDVEKLGETAGRKKSTGGRKPNKDADTRALEKSLTDRIGMTVTIDHHGNGGKVTVAYKTLEQLDDICRRLRG
jgi:ParB family transcriptional regulator, chromosome partitioning protein